MDGLIWDRLGVWVWEIGNNGLDGNLNNYIRYMKENGFGWFAIQAFNGDTLMDQTIMAKWRNALWNNNMGFVIWGVHHNDPEGDAQRASAQINLWGADAYIANAEDEYKTDNGGTRAHSAAFVNEFRDQQPSIKCALSSYGAAAGENIFGSTTDVNASVFDYKSWYDAGFHFMPQAYINQDSAYAPNLVLRHAKRAAWPFRYVHPTIGIFGIPNVVTDTPTHNAADYRALLQAFDSDSNLNGIVGSRYRGYGWSVFHVHSMVEQDFIDMGKFASLDKAARTVKQVPSYYDVVIGHKHLLAYYRMNHTGSFEDEQVGWAADGTYVGTPTRGEPSLIIGDSEQTATDYGTMTPKSVKTSNGNYLSLGTPFQLDPSRTPTWTIEAWVKIDTNPGGSGVICRENTIGNIQWELGFGADTIGDDDKLMGGFYEFNNGDWFVIRDSVSPTYGIPLHIALTWDGDWLRLYKQGTQVASNSTSRNPPTGAAGNHLIGQRHGVEFTQYGFPGWIQDVAYYRQALSAAELLRHYQVGLGSLTTNTKRSGGVVRVN